MPRTVLVTSTTPACRHVVSKLLSSPDCPAIRVITRSAVGIQETFPPQLRSEPHSIILVEDFRGPVFAAAFRGVSVVFHNGPVLLPSEETMAIATIDEARIARVEHFVFCSVLQPIRVKLTTHKVKLRLEEYLIESRLNYTILQPPHYMQNVSIRHSLVTGKIPLGYSPNTSHGFIDLVDLATVVRNIVMDPVQHRFARYEIVGQNISYNDIASAISRISRRNVRCDVMTSQEFVEKMRTSEEVRNEYAEDSLMRLLVYYDRWGLTGNTNVLRWLLGREPGTWEGYVRRELS
ncbi:hypothetical protein M422DRAFT_263584 [Sphaerobolus stellatus SS14]|uniref:NmrA-like domain-containing protein n=1 Tax=Sphaerobolus stellatus (strain SS14) TaxID=990650 RepID=A0A0C9T8W3_SPHS4|nr:hypothetical protein M422DRAFT_785561 [Sphaerobolus stellatus SS14]KIJ34270.1 hypothetical protein M422DRAFT_263584 [Sphaerobolus stellatus SS14]